MNIRDNPAPPQADSKPVSDVAEAAVQRTLLAEVSDREEADQSNLIALLFGIAVLSASSDLCLSQLASGFGFWPLAPMAQSNAVAIILLLAGACLFKRYGLLTGKIAFYLAVLFAFAGHAFWVGYGLGSPGLTFMSLLIIQEALGPQRNNLLCPLSAASIGLLAIIGVAQFFDAIALAPVPLSHQLVVTTALLFSSFLLGRKALASRAATTEHGIQATMGQLRLNHDLQTALEARNRFFSAVSHEMRTPLHGIVSALHLVRHPRSAADAKERYLNTIDASVADLSKIIDDVLDLSRLQSGGFPLATEPTDLAALCQQQIDFFKADAQKHGLALQFERRTDHSTWVLADGLRLRQMLNNYVSNSLKFTQRGSVSLSLDVLPDPAALKTLIWRFTVTDTGCGIAAESLEKLFKPFSQLEHAAAGGTQGSGLGLSIVSGLANQMGGQAGVNSVLGVGSAFWFTARLANATA